MKRKYGEDEERAGPIKLAKGGRRACAAPDCFHAATYGPKKQGIRCKNHREPGDRQIKTICRHPECLRAGLYGPGGKRHYCSSHFLPKGLVYEMSLCRSSGCKKVANYGPGMEAFYCDIHKTPDCLPRMGMKCKTGGCRRQVKATARGSGLCKICSEILVEKKEFEKCKYFDCTNGKYQNLHGIKEFCLYHWRQQNGQICSWPGCISIHKESVLGLDYCDAHAKIMTNEFEELREELSIAIAE